MITKLLSYLKHLTTSHGMVQHCIDHNPDLRHGYSIDDNARAIIALCAVADQYGLGDLAAKIKPYLDFIAAAQTKAGWFVNFFDAGFRPLETKGSSDSFGRTVWALSVLQANRHSRKLAATARALLKKSLPNVSTITWLRSIAFCLFAATARGDIKQTNMLADKLVKQFQTNATKDWPWFEDRLTYANGIFPWALAEAAVLTKNNKILAIAEKTFKFLDKTCRADGKPAPIGNHGWYPKNGKKAVFDQQPIDAADIVLAAVALHKATKKLHYLEIARRWFSWFSGNNVKAVVMLNPMTGGVYDGITRHGVNHNQGAESVLVYIIAHCALDSVNHKT